VRSSAHSLAGRAALVTGAARGIGAETARRLAARGARVALVGHEANELARVAADCPGSVWREVDVTDVGALTKAIDDAAGALGGLDAVVANAAIYAPGTIRTIDDAVFARTLEVNVLGVIRTVRAALPHLERSDGYVLVVSSVLAVMQAPGFGAYAPSKAAVEAFANVLRVEASVLGIEVGTAYFALVDTEMLRGFDSSPTGGYLYRHLPRPLRRATDVGAAAEAIAAGIEQRARVVAWLRWLRAVLLLRGFTQPLLDARLRRLMPALDQIAEDDRRRRGAAASAPVGAGGQADRPTDGDRRISPG
jgi:NAD(P)-dependent dehydrogenase (short-subunit alcohol dehydrogenase family)